MDKLKIPHDAFVLVGDGRKALFLRNEGDEKYPNLKTERVLEDVNPLTHEQGSERPGHISKARNSCITICGITTSPPSRCSAISRSTAPRYRP